MRNKLVFCLLGLPGLLCLSSSLAVAAGAPGDFDRIVKQAHAALAKFDSDSARALLSQACQPDASASDISARTAICESEMGAIEEAAGRVDAAEIQYLRALSIWNQLAPGHAAYRAATLMNLGSVYRAQRRPAEAEDVLNQAFAIARQTTGEDRQPSGRLLQRIRNAGTRPRAAESGDPDASHACAFEPRRTGLRLEFTGHA